MWIVSFTFFMLHGTYLHELNLNPEHLDGESVSGIYLTM